LGLKQYIATSYKPSPVANTELVLQPSLPFSNYKDEIATKQQKIKGRPKITANRFIINEVGDFDNDGEFNLKDVAKQLQANKNNEWKSLESDGDFRSPECIELLKQADIVVTNPPFSLFREYVKQLFDYNKKFLIIGNMNAITYKEIFPLIKDNRMWLGVTMDGRNKWFQVPDDYPIRENVANYKIENDRKFLFVKGCLWFTNLDHGRRHQPLPLMTMEENRRFNKKVQKNPHCYQKYDNYDAIEVPYTDAIPSDYDGVMGVPVTFVDKYNPDQFEIIDINPHFFMIVEKGLPKPPQLKITGYNDPYARILIKHRKVKK